MTGKILFETKIENPNRPGNSFFLFLYLFSTLLPFIALLSMNTGFMLFSIFFMFFVRIMLVLLSGNKNDATFQLSQINEQKHLIKLIGENLDFQLEGELHYELWRKPTKRQRRRRSYIYNASNISIFAPNREQILIQGDGEYKEHETTWGFLREASPYPIGITLEMKKIEIEAIKSALEKHQIKLSNTF